MRRSEFETIELDTKGRILIPMYIRRHFGLKNGVEMLVLAGENNTLKIVPVHNKQSVEIQIFMSDIPGSLAKTAEVFKKNNINIISSRSEIIEKGKNAKWSVIADIKDIELKKLKDDLDATKTVKKISIYR